VRGRQSPTTIHATRAGLTSAGAFITKWGISGTGDGEFDMPWRVAMGAGGDVYVDRGNDRIEVFSSSGTFTGTWGSFGTASGEFDDPQGIAVGPNGDVYVASSRVQKFTGTGDHIAQWGVAGSGEGQFDGTDVAVSGGEVYVADRNHRIQVFGCP
jgi:hypothetical protein